MKTSPNETAPQLDVEAIIEELVDLFNQAEDDGHPVMKLESHVGSTFHARVMNAAKHLGILT